MKRFHKVLALGLAGGLLLTVAFVLQIPFANANFPEITFVPFCETVHLSITDPLPISIIPNWSNPSLGSVVPYRLYFGAIGAGNIIFSANINRPNSLSTSLSDGLTPCGEYNHVAEYAPFQFRSGPFWVDRGTQF